MKKSEYLISELRGAPVYTVSKKMKRIGKVHSFIFHPHKRRVVGFTVKRPDIALMMHRPDLFVAFDGFDIQEGTMNLREPLVRLHASVSGFLGTNALSGKVFL